MSTNELNDAELSRKIKGKLSRSQISRIRRGVSGTSLENAKRLERLTGIPWPSFIEVSV